jgi:type I restriction enzyme M protein
LKFEEVIAASSNREGERPRETQTKERISSGASPSRADAARAAREKAEAELAELQSRIAPLEKEINQLTRQFWVMKEKVVAEKYDLSASRYRQVEQEEVFYEKPAVTLERMRQLEQAAESDVATLEKMMGKS